MSDRSQVAIEVVDLRYRYEDGFQALNGVNFIQKQGESVVLFGPNGSGKTTFALHLNGTLSGEGEVRIAGKAIKRGDPFAKQKVGFLFQDPNDQLFMPTVLEDVAFGLLNLNLDPEECRRRALQELDRFGVGHTSRKPPHQLSSGEKQRVALAGLVVMDPDILVLDEPTAALDPRGIGLFIELIQALPQTKLVITHDARFSRKVAERAVFFEAGKIVADGSVEEVAQQFEWDI